MKVITKRQLISMIKFNYKIQPHISDLYTPE